MSMDSDDDRAWTAEKRIFVADDRDEMADLRDVGADRRDAAADVREAQLDHWGDLLRARAEQLGLAVQGTWGAPDEPDDRAARERAREDRAIDLQERQAGSVEREAAAHRRVADDRPTLLALAFASIGDQLYDTDTYDLVLTRIAEAAVATVRGAEMASVTVVEDGTYGTVGPTDPAAAAFDRAQFEAHEGPSLDALDLPIVTVPSFPDERWPVLGGHPTEDGVQSSLSFHLSTWSSAEGESGSGSLNIYASSPAAFDQAAQEIGFILAAHASLAARAAGERASLEGLALNLQQAVLSRDVIGQAKGILMERLRTTPEDAFDILRRSSQRLNLKLLEVARRLTESGEIKDDAARS